MSSGLLSNYGQSGLNDLSSFENLNLAAAIQMTDPLQMAGHETYAPQSTYLTQPQLSQLAEYHALAQLSNDPHNRMLSYPSSNQYLPSRMVPPPSPGTMSYMYHQNRGWLNHLPTYGRIDNSWFEQQHPNGLHLDPIQQQQMIAQVLEMNGGMQQFQRMQQQWQQQIANVNLANAHLAATSQNHAANWQRQQVPATDLGYYQQQLAAAQHSSLLNGTAGNLFDPLEDQSQTALAAAAAAAAAAASAVPSTDQVLMDSNFTGLPQSYGLVNPAIPSTTMAISSGPTMVPGSQVPVVDARKAEWRDHLLAYAHQLYSTSPYDQNLLPLLHTLHDLHPCHLPSLLLLACVYYTHHNYKASLHYNQQILTIDENYVEAMSNIGTTLRSMGRQAEAEDWWYKAVRRRPNYWDAVENLVGVLCSTGSQESKDKTDTAPPPKRKPRYKEALEVCEFVESNVLRKQQETSIPAVRRPISLPSHLPPHSAPRLQNLFYAKGNLRYALGDIGGAKVEYEKGLEVVFGGKSVIEVVVAVIQAATGASEVPLNVTLPMVLLLPEQSVGITSAVFSPTLGVLPGLVAIASGVTANPSNSSSSSTNSLSQANQTTSTILLTLAKLFQDIMGSSVVDEQKVYLGGLPPSLPLLLPLYYLSLSLHPSPSTCNNLGILLSTIAATATVTNSVGQTQTLNGQGLALQYYTYGLQLDQRHPHLYTNLGSLLKDMGHLQEAVRMYEKAVECNPKFDVALANLGNAVKDMGRIQDSVQWYMRAVEVNPNFAEAVCGLVNALGGVCDWRARGGVGSPEAVDAQGKLVLMRESSPGARLKSGWMGKVVDIVNKQLNEGASFGFALVANTGGIDKWIPFILEILPKAESAVWTQRLMVWVNRAAAATAKTKSQSRINEGGWIIRLIERLMRRVQRQWYLDTYGPLEESLQLLPRIQPDPNSLQKYKRPLLPTSLPQPAVPTVLPFHTFTYPLSPREVRLISHRNGLRISQATLNAPWVPETVFPPPSPPAFGTPGGRLKIGYVSSDFNNHPLSHLMQSVFGFHDLSRYEIFSYATTPSDNSPYRRKIEAESEHFLDVSTWTNKQVVDKILQDGIHILVNLNGYTKGARNEIFAARPCPVQTSFMGFAGTLGGGWCDWIIADAIVCPPEMVSGEKWRKMRTEESKAEDVDENVTAVEGYNAHLTSFEGDIDPEEPDDDWVYTEKFIYMPHTYFVNDHKQGFRDEDAEAAVAAGLQVGNGGLPSAALSLKAREQMAQYSRTERDPEGAWLEEQDKRWKMRKELFPGLDNDSVIFANFNQLYKIDPAIFKTWLRILARVPKSILWLLRFPADGEQHLSATAERWAGKEVASRVIFTDVAPKHIHIHRGRIADLFLDTPECNAHTTAADILWSGTPILTYPRHVHKMCSRVAASIVKATGYGEEMTVWSAEDYENKAVSFAESLGYEWVVEEGNGKFGTHENGIPVAQMMEHQTPSSAATTVAPPSQTALNQSAIPLQMQGMMAPMQQAQPQQQTRQPQPPTTNLANPDITVPSTGPPTSTPIDLHQQSKYHRLGHGPLIDLRRRLFLERERSRLFDTERWTRNVERGLEEAWRRWVNGAEMEDIGTNVQVKYAKEGLHQTGCIWVVDPDD